MTPRVLLCFLDGVGIGPADPETNPFLRARLHRIRAVLGGAVPHLQAPEVQGPRALAFPLDASLGVPGLPQSGTGQTALLTGENAAARFGRHFGPWVPVALRPLLAERNILSRAVSLGFSCTFANAYPRKYQERALTRRPAAPPLVARAAGVRICDEKELARGGAVSSEIVNLTWRTRLHHTEVPDITPEEAGRNLGALSRRSHLTFFAHYATDLAGHTGDMDKAVAALDLVDRFLEGLLPELTSPTLLVITSDHGNIEDTSRGHTLNPAFTLLFGSHAKEHRSNLSSITQVPGMILRHLQARG